MDIMNLLSGGALGALTGLLGSGITAYVAFKNKKLDIQDNKDKRAHRLDEMQKEADNAIQIEKLQQVGEVERQDSNLMSKAMDMLKGNLFKKDYAQYMPKWLMGVIAFLFALVDIMRCVVRPGGTLYLLYIMSDLTYKVYEKRPELFLNSITDPWAVIAYMGSTSYMWWFGDRRLAKAMATRLSV